MGANLLNKGYSMRSIWKGAISFGLVNIPVRMYSASHEKELKFVMLHGKDLSEIRYAKMCKAEEKEIPWEEIVKGYEYSKGEFVIINDEDFEKADLRRTKSIDIMDFILEEEIDSRYYTKPYFLEPEKGANNAYALLREALTKSKKVGIAKYVLRNREHIAVVKAIDDVLVLNQMRYYNELAQPADLSLPAVKKGLSKELDIALQLIDQLTVPFEPEKYHDTYTEEMKKIIEKKAKGEKIHPKGQEPKATKVEDIMSLLKESLDKNKKPKRTRKSA